MSTIVATEHPYVVQMSGVCSGRPVIRGTRIPVRSIVGYYKLGLSIEEILEGLPHLTAAQVHDALSYYHDHREEIEQEIDKNRIEKGLNAYNVKMNRQGKLVPKRQNGRST